MMQRLRDQAIGRETDPALREAVRLVRGVERYQPSPEARTRVLRQLDKAAPPSTRPPWLTSIPLVLIVGAAWWFARPEARSSSPTVQPAADAPAVVAPAVEHALSPPLPVNAPPPVAAEHAAEQAAAPTSSTASRLRSAARPHTRRGQATAPSTPSPAAADDAETALLLAAIRAYRIDHDMERADLLISDYLAHSPKGVVLEEAMAMRLDTANGTQGRRQAAEAYLKQFPVGQWAAKAQRMLDESAGE